MFDTIIIGAGIAGITTAYWLHSAGQKVLLIDRKGLLAGASGAAGAFISPRLGKGGELQRITNRAYLFALEFYAQKTPESFFQKGLVRIPKNRADAEKFENFITHLDVPFRACDEEDTSFVAKKHLKNGALCFLQSAFVDPMSVAKKLLEDIKTAFGIDAKPFRKGDMWCIDGYLAKNIVVATGANRLPLNIPYLEIGGVWGERIDVKSDASIPMSLHKHISVSANIDGNVRIGATHVRGGSKSEIERLNDLIVGAIDLVPELKDQKLTRIYAGLRSSVNDHFPIAGAVANAEKTIEKFGMLSKKDRISLKEIPKIEGCYFTGCFGGRGFVFAPLIGKMTADAILGNENIESVLSSGRFLLRYMRKKKL